MSKPAIVLDKSFLYSSPKRRIEEISISYKILITDSLTYEVIKDNNNKRSRLFSKLVPIIGELAYIPIVGDLIRFEQKELLPCYKPSRYIKSRDYSVINKLADENYHLSEKEQTAIENYKSTSTELHNLVLTIIKQTFQAYSNDEAEIEYKSLLNGKIKDQKLINNIISRERQNGALVPNVEIFDENWVSYRYFQVYHLFALDIRSRYQKVDDIFNSEKTKEKILHDIHDMNYLVLALLEGGFATSENKLIKWWEAIHGKIGLIKC